MRLFDIVFALVLFALIGCTEDPSSCNCPEGDTDADCTDCDHTDADCDGYVESVDCNDQDAGINPSAEDVCDNGIDENCDYVDGYEYNGVTYYVDADGDGYGSTDPNQMAIGAYCGAPAGYVADNTDCDDHHAFINPGAIEICDSLDNDCDGMNDEGYEYYLAFFDADGDGFGGQELSAGGCPGTEPPGFVDNDDDCDDTNATIYPGSIEITVMVVGLDWDCDGAVWCSADLDGDGYGDSNHGYSLWPYTFSDNEVCGDEAGEASLEYTDTDCDDDDATVNPTATEICNGVDDNCDDQVDETCE